MIRQHASPFGCDLFKMTIAMNITILTKFFCELHVDNHSIECKSTKIHQNLAV